MSFIYATEKYLEDKKDKSKKIANALNKIEYEISNMEYLSAHNYLIKIGGKNSRFDDSKMWHFRPNGTGNAYRVFYSISSDIKDETLDAFQINKKSLVLYSISEEANHDKNQQVAKGLRNNEEQYLYYPLNSTKKEIDEAQETPIYKSLYGFPIDNQQKSLLIREGPVIIIGSAGSGKTITAIELYKRYYLENSEQKTAFVTLTQRLKNKVVTELTKCGFTDINLFTFAEFSGLKYNDQDHYIDFVDTIIADKENNKHDQKFSKLLKKYPYILNKHSVYTIIRGFIKGRLNANNDYKTYDKEKEIKCLKAELIKEENYEQLLGKDTNAVIDYIFEIYRMYEQTNEADDNDFEFNPSKQWDCLIIDEVQDLTELQVKFLAESIKAPFLYFYGDPNQTINPTFFKFSRLEGIIKKIINCPSVCKELLKETYRSGPYLIEYVNHLSSIRKELIGTQSDAWDEDEKSLVKKRDTNWACIIYNETSIRRLFEIFGDSEDCVIIVNTLDKKNELKERYKDLLGNTELILSITDIKGLENKNIIIYDMISDNLERFNEILDKKYKKSTIHRMIFNRFYVAITRAKESIVIVETKLDDKLLLKEKFFEYQRNSEKCTVENVDNNLELVENYISKSKNPEAFIKSANRFKEQGFYPQAFEKIQRALELAKEQEEFQDLIPKINRELKVIELIKSYYSTKNLTLEEKNDIAEELALRCEYLFSTKIYEDIGNLSNKRLIEFLSGNAEFNQIFDEIKLSTFKNQEIYKIICDDDNLYETYEKFIEKVTEYGN